MATEGPTTARTVVVTGANRGIGYAVARELVQRGCRVVLLARDPERGAEACRALAALGGPGVELQVADLSCARTVRSAAEALLARCPRIDVLIHNAGLWPTRLERNEDGLEQAFAVNHLAPFLLNHLLEPRLVSSRTRVVQVSAGLYVQGRPDPARTPTGADFHPLRTYATTKLCNLLMMPLFAERWRDAGVTIDAVHPGVIRTGLGDRDGFLGFLLRGIKRLWKRPEEGARPVVKLALEPAGGARTGRYFHLEREVPLEPVARDAELARRLWAQACELSEIDDAARPVIRHVPQATTR